MAALAQQQQQQQQLSSLESPFSSPEVLAAPLLMHKSRSQNSRNSQQTRVAGPTLVERLLFMWCARFH